MKALQFFLRKITKPNAERQSQLNVIIHESGRMNYRRGDASVGSINIGRHSVLTIEDNISINAKIIVSDNSKMKIGKNCVLNNVVFDIRNNGEVVIEEGVIFNCPGSLPNYIQVNNGKLVIKEKAKIFGDLLVRFSGVLTIGRHTGIGSNSDIRCEERIDIGDFCMFSYDICAYDTNTHSTNWEERRERMIAGYPGGAAEIKRPNTKPIVIGDDVWIGRGATITKGAQLGNRCIVGVRTVVGGGTYEDDCTIVSNKPHVIIKNK